MRIFAFAVAAGAFTVSLSPAATPPTTIAGLLFSERISAPGRFMNRYRIVEFGADGRWRDLAVFDDVRPAFVPISRPRSSGTYAYGVTSGMEAEVTMTVEDGPASPEGPSRLLEFSDATSGTLSLPIGIDSFFRFTEGQSKAPLVNQSSRAVVTSTSPQRSGFVLREASFVLVRAIGPGLAQFGIPQPARNPSLQIARGELVMATSDDWNDEQAAVGRVSQIVGAFPLTTQSRDAAVVVHLNAGAYVASASTEMGDSGEVLLEIYFFHSLGER
jgi:hypothetical protein